ncbi:hypothetical protein GS597_09095 [Synechococcales cyanobacterium C]|uniref:Mor transcription activator domain-containing protein n=1 Tax=Petrachloros mirabilis ULC683 TaxID=2781853 RepID=A0A8K1ZYY2_9CYAN|nr:Mor transcription activator family protein [Petrachloros mirabilis]NCJ06658.1 hypothetical protein [Petrachloros mirabilis ULC683]
MQQLGLEFFAEQAEELPPVADRDPPIVQHLRRLLTDAELLLFLQNYGGQRIYIPKCESALTSDHPLVQAIGLKGAQRLVGAYRGDTLVVPRGQAMFRRLRDKRICEEYLCTTAAELASRYNLSVLHVYAIVGKHGVKKGTTRR